MTGIHAQMYAFRVKLAFYKLSVAMGNTITLEIAYIQCAYKQTGTVICTALSKELYSTSKNLNVGV